MSKRTATWLAWLMWTATLVLSVVGPVLLGATSSNSPANSPVDAEIGLFLLLTVVAVATIGAIVSSRRRQNPIGWLLGGAALFLSLTSFAQLYANQALLVRPGFLPAVTLMAWVATWINRPLLLAVLVAIFLLFPNGRLLSPRWRPVIWLTYVAVLAMVLWALKPGPFTDFPTINNPLGINGADGILEAFGDVSFILLLVCLLLSGVSMVLRFRRSRGEERQQLKWLASAAAFTVTGWLCAPIIWNIPALNGSPLWPLLFVLTLLSIPIAIGIAILRYRLYEIDIIIRRTLIYSALTVVLALVYFGSVTLLQELLSAVSGQRSDIAIILSTLAIATLFVPVRSRVQRTIDHRFYRRKYDAAQVLANFAGTVRDEVDLNQLTGELIDVVQETMQPEQVSLWLRTAGEGKRRSA